MEWKNVFITIIIIALLFFSVPVQIGKNKTQTESLFNDFINRFNKSYSANETEYSIRLKIFEGSMLIINELNANQSSAKYGITKFSDLTREEFKERHLQRHHHHHHHKKDDDSGSREKRAALLTLPEKVDWRKKGVISKVRNQNTCGACWAFSTVETVESMNALLNRTLQILSVQELIDCARNGNNGCDGGDSKLLLEWLVSSGTVIEPESSYPYLHTTGTCKYKASSTGVKIKTYSCKNFVGSEDAILDLLSNHGPLAVAVNAANWQFYLGGVIQYHCSGALEDLNHAVQLVGYDKSNIPPFYIARNSWGTDFGDSGYLYISLDKNLCGVANEVCSLDVF